MQQADFMCSFSVMSVGSLSVDDKDRPYGCHTLSTPQAIQDCLDLKNRNLEIAKNNVSIWCPTFALLKYEYDQYGMGRAPITDMFTSKNINYPKLEY
jgi:hypothetical protein